FGEACLDQRPGVGRASTAAAGGAFAEKIVLQPLAIGGLREHARERVFADAARPGEEQRAWDALAAEHSAQRAGDSFVAEILIEAHGISGWRGARGKCAPRQPREPLYEFLPARA